MLLPLLLNNLMGGGVGPVLVAVPDVVGETQAQGTNDLQAALFVVTVVTAYSSVVPVGIIISQDPIAGSLEIQGSNVTITVSLGPVPPVPVVEGITALELIYRAMRLVGIVSAGSGETLTAEEATDGLGMLNDLLEMMSIENLFVWGKAVETFTWPANTASRTIGPTGDFVTTRPVRIHAAYSTILGIDYPAKMVGQFEYNDITFKTDQCDFPREMLFVNDHPNGRLSVWPLPTQAVPITLTIDRVILKVAAVSEVLSFPPAYLSYLRHQLAIMLAPEYGVVPTQTIYENARLTKAAIKRANHLKRTAYFDEALSNRTYVDWRTGE